MKSRWTKCIPIFAITASLLTGCGGASSGSGAMMSADSTSSVTNNASQEYYEGVASDSYVKAEEVEEAIEDSKSLATEQALDNITLLEEKLVYHCNLEIETLDYSSTMTSIKETISKYGGVIQSESESDSGYDWYYENYRKTSGTLHNYLEIRIPSKNYNSFLSELDGVGKIISKSTSVDNISQKYYDTTAQIEALKIQEKNLLAMLEKCETIEDMITVEQRLSEVQYELNSLQTTRRYMDMDVAYSYVNINISEVMEYRQDNVPVRRNTFADRLKNTLLSTGRGFLLFLEGLLFLVIRLSPYLVIIIIICFTVLKKKIKRFMEERKLKKGARFAQKINMQQTNMQQNTGWNPPPAKPTQNNFQQDNEK